MHGQRLNAMSTENVVNLCLGCPMGQPGERLAQEGIMKNIEELLDRLWCGENDYPLTLGKLEEDLQGFAEEAAETDYPEFDLSEEEIVDIREYFINRGLK